MVTRSTIVGIFADQQAATDTIQALQKAGFTQHQLGFITHDGTSEHTTTTAPEQQSGRGPNALARGLVGGIMGALDILLVPITGPADASLILQSTLPVAEEAIDRLPYPGSQHDEAAHQRPDAPMTVQDTPNNTQKHDTPPTNTTAQTPEQQTEASERGSIVTGSVIGGLLGAAVALLIPGVGPIIAGGMLASIFGGAAIGGIAGGFLGTFMTMGIPEDKAHYYEEEFKAGRTIVAIHTNKNQQEAMDILRQHGAQDVQEHHS